MMVRSLIVLLAVVLLPVAACGAGELTDPYEILMKHYEAIGGLDRLKAEESVHFVADLKISGLSGTIESWQIRPDQSRLLIDLGVLKFSTGDDGTTVWELDTNGKLRIEQDPFALARREAARRIALFEHLDPASGVFTVELLSIREIQGIDCYVIRIVNTIDNVERVWFIGTDDFLMSRSEDNRPDEQQHTDYSDYREVGGVLRAFRQDVEILPIGQIQTMDVTLIEIDTDIDPAVFEPPADSADDYVFVSGGDSEEVSFEFISDHIFVPVVLDCRERLWVLDSGASVSVIDRGYAEELGLPISGEIVGQGAGNTVQVAFTTLPSFRVGGIEFGEQQVAVIDFVGLFRRISDLEVVGILGYDFMSRFVTKVDYANEMLTFYEPETFVYQGGGTVLDAPLKENLFSVEASVDGVYEGQWMLDLGAGGMSFHSDFAREHDLGARKGVYGVSFGAGGRFMRHRSQYESVEFGGFTVEKPLVASHGYDSEHRGAFTGGEQIGNLGNSLFRHFVLYLDYADQKVIVEKGDDFGTQQPENRAGLQIWRPDEAVELLYVAPGTPAEEAGFAEGDVVKSINGIDVAHFGGLLALNELMREDPGTEYAVRVERGGEQLDLKLVLRDLY